MEIVYVNPGNLRLPPSRRSGADPFKLADQTQRFGDATSGMPPVLVTIGKDGEMVINDGVTRATRIARLRPDAIIPVKVIERRPAWSFAHLPRVKETL